MRRILLVLGTMFIASIAAAQIHFNLNFNIDRQPIWGPAGYDHVEY